MFRRISNIDKLKQQMKLNQQVKELLQRGEIDMENPFHFEVILHENRLSLLYYLKMKNQGIKMIQMCLLQHSQLQNTFMK
ncbi:unnamed protein product [Paramecium primaurelia]|uniref:Uncharacterized protein n=1 Tax=Paramecium primaurelia TaxID=5886 RepID=A0A8S1P1A1_PARPR|nr:unnamed protein product [Paramecium primaurelia]